MAGTFITGQRRKIYVEDVQSGTSVSESIGSKIGSTLNHIIDRYVQKFPFGAGGTGGVTLSSLVTPYVFTGYSEIAVENFLAIRISVFLQETGTSGNTEFYIERRPVSSGTWSNILSTNCVISSSASDNLLFKSDSTAPSGVTLTVLNISNVSEGDEFRFVLQSSAVGANNLKAYLEVSPN